MRKLLSILISFCFCLSATFAASLLVPDQYATIQAGIDAAADGDIVSVADGIYTGDGNRDISFFGKAITVESVNGPDACVIDCQGTPTEEHRGFAFINSETSTSVLDGFTIKNGYLENTRGGGIFCDNASPIIMNCAITNNYAVIGGGVALDDGTLLDSVVMDNVGKYDWYFGTPGAGISTGNGVISSCIITNNGDDCGVLVTGQTRIENCIISDNYTGSGVKAYCDRVGEPCGQFEMVNCLITGHDSWGVTGALPYTYESTMTNCIVWENQEPGVRYSVDVEYCNVQGGANGEGNIDADPLLVQDLDWGFYLSQVAAGQDQDSPCLNAGKGLASQTFVTGVDGSVALNTMTTRTDHVGDTGKVDMGPHFLAQNVSIPDPMTGVSLVMPGEIYQSGDRVRCDAIVTNATGADMVDYPLFVILECYDTMFFAPSFGTEFDHYGSVYSTIPVGETLVSVIPEFIWPDVSNGMATFLSAITDPDVSNLVGDWVILPFGWE